MSMSSAESKDVVQGWLRSRLAERLGIDPQAIDIREPFSRYALDSIRAMRLLSRLAEFLGRPLSLTLVWEDPTSEALARHLAGGKDSGSRALVSGRPAVRRDEPIAVVVMACR